MNRHVVKPFEPTLQHAVEYIPGLLSTFWIIRQHESTQVTEVVRTRAHGRTLGGRDRMKACDVAVACHYVVSPSRWQASIASEKILPTGLCFVWTPNIIATDISRFKGGNQAIWTRRFGDDNEGPNFIIIVTGRPYELRSK